MKRNYWTRATAITCCLGFLGMIAMQKNPSWSQGEVNPIGQLSQQPFMAANRAIAPAQVASAGSAMMASVILANGFQQLAVVDHAKTTIAVYHIDPSSGDIQLKSVRRFDADFALEEFNLSEPTPSTIRKNVR